MTKLLKTLKFFDSKHKNKPLEDFRALTIEKYIQSENKGFDVVGRTSVLNPFILPLKVQYTYSVSQIRQPY